MATRNIGKASSSSVTIIPTRAMKYPTRDTSIFLDLRNSFSEEGRIILLMVRFIRDELYLAKLGTTCLSPLYTVSLAFIIIGVSMLMAKQKVPAKGFSWAALVTPAAFAPTEANMTDSAPLPHMDVPMNVADLPENPRKYARALVRSRSPRITKGTAITTIQMTVGNIPGSISMPNDMKNTATRASLNGDMRSLSRSEILVSANTMPRKNAPMMAGTPDTSAMAERRGTPGRARTGRTSRRS